MFLFGYALSREMSGIRLGLVDGGDLAHLAYAMRRKRKKFLNERYTWPSGYYRNPVFREISWNERIIYN